MDVCTVTHKELADIKLFKHFYQSRKKSPSALLKKSSIEIRNVQECQPG